jgi:hypothetical protein
MAQVEEYYLPSKNKTLSSNPSIIKKKKRISQSKYHQEAGSILKIS